MNSIIRRDEIITKLAKNEILEKSKAIECINLKLTETVKLPITVSPFDLGNTIIVRNEIIRLLKEAGWRIEHFNENGVDFYTIE